MKFKPTKRSIIIAVASVFIIAGLVGTIPTLYYHWSNNGSAKASAGPFVYAEASNPSTPQPTLVSGYPDNLQVPSLHFNLSVVPGVYNPKTGAWNVGLSAAQYATPSDLPNNLTGDTLIYGHYRPAVFAYLHLIKPGALATVSTSNGYSFTYKYVGTYAMSPNDTSIFNYRGGPILTLQTCSGAYFQNRQMYQFDFVSYTKV